MSVRRPKADKERTDSAVEEPAIRQPDRSRARRRLDRAQDEAPPVDLDERERLQRRRRKPSGPAEPPTPPPPPPAPSPRRRGALTDDETIADIPPTDPVYDDER